MAVTAAVVIACACLGWYGHLVVAEPKLVIAIFVAIAGAVLMMMPSERTVIIGFYAWIITFAFGYRYIWLTPDLGFHPSEVLVWILFATTVGRKTVRRERLGLIPAQISANLFLALSALGVLTGWRNGVTAWGEPLEGDLILAQFKPILLIVPIFFVVREVVTDRRRLDLTLNLLILVAVYSSLLGLLEFFAPSPLRPLLEKLFRGVGGEMAPGGFLRADFSFWGNAFVAIFLVLNLPWLLHRFLHQERVGKVAFGAGFLLVSSATFFSGYRTAWFLLVIVIGIYTLLKSHSLLVLMCLLTVPIAQILPEGFYGRLNLLVHPDPGTMERVYRSQAAIRFISRQPLFGHGWGASGWVHNEFLLIAANAGIPTLLAFLAWCGGILYGLLKVLRQPANDWRKDYSAALFTMFIAMMAIFATHSIIVLPQMMAPSLLFLALCDRLPNLPKDSSWMADAAHEQTSEIHGEAFRPRSYLQQ